jgi:hypothetical protein
MTPYHLIVHHVMEHYILTILLTTELALNLVQMDTLIMLTNVNR